MPLMVGWLAYNFRGREQSLSATSRTQLKLLPQTTRISSLFLYEMTQPIQSFKFNTKNDDGSERSERAKLDDLILESDGVSFRF